MLSAKRGGVPPLPCQSKRHYPIMGICEFTYAKYSKQCFPSSVLRCPVTQREQQLKMMWLAGFMFTEGGTFHAIGTNRPMAGTKWPEKVKGKKKTQMISS